MDNRWTFDKLMDSLSTCHLGLVLLWTTILLTLVQRSSSNRSTVTRVLKTSAIDKEVLKSKCAAASQYGMAQGLFHVRTCPICHAPFRQR